MQKLKLTAENLFITTIDYVLYYCFNIIIMLMFNYQLETKNAEKTHRSLSPKALKSGQSKPTGSKRLIVYL